MGRADRPARTATPRRALLRAVAALALVSAIPPAVSLTSALTADTGEPLAGKLASWARDHHLGPLVDWAERVRYSSPPSPEPADELATEALGSGADGVLPVRPGGPVPPQSHLPPDPLPAPVSPPLPGEGEWVQAREIDGVPVVWTTGVRPSAEFGSVRASFALLDPSRLTAALFNGTQVPGGSGWERGSQVPADLHGALVFAHNGGFRREHAGGGYFTEGREVWELRRGAASLAIDARGRVRVGSWGVELDPSGNDGSAWVSVRQNLTLLVDDGVPSSEIDRRFWGASSKNEIFILRSAVCERFDGKLLFAIAGDVDAATLAATMVLAGCRDAMQLDVNASYPRGYSYQDGIPRRLDTRMAGRDDLYLSGSHREFIAFFDPAALG